MNVTIPIDSILLVPDEVKAITGRSHRKEQMEWLRSNGWKFAVNAANDPVIGRLYATLKLAGQELGGVSIGAGLPDFSKMD